ncbi:protein BANP isoform X2 [Oncorhynchus mykiss]|uniref:protein BANP isoform X2 n=1 Tax=Oncorhynchus mykiss TaxID=8022 RepID=UPI001877A870|nr:protein BANP isoform X2 [Oncorhynchus mykiss]
MSDQDLADMVQIAVEDLGQGDQTDVLDNHEDCDDKPDRKRPRVDNSSQDTSLKTLLYSISQTICQRLDNMEAKLQMVEATCRALERKLDAVVNKNQAPIQVPMVAGSPLGATQTWNKVRCVVPQTNVIVSQDRPKGQEEPVTRGADSLENLLSNTVGGRRQNTFLVKVPAPEDSQEDQESGSEASDSVSNSGQTNNAQSTQNVTLITLNSEGHLFYKFGITESDWYRIKQSIDSKCRTAWRRKQRGQSLAVKSFSRRSANAPGSSEGGAVVEAAQQTLHYTLANQTVQQVQIHRIGEDGQVQVIPQGHLHIAQVPQGEEVQITQDSEGNLQIHQVHVGQDGQVLRGAQLIAVASADGGATAVEGSPLQASDIQVQYVQLAQVNDHNATVQAAELAPAMQGEMEVKEGSLHLPAGENGEVVQIVTSVGT